jgi:hypothetical protein
MKMLLDENLPQKLGLELKGHEVLTVKQMGWSGKKNGELVRLMLQNGFQALITFDQNIQYQQNFEKYPIAVFILIAEKNKLEFLSPLIPKVQVELQKEIRAGVLIIQ